MEYSEWTHLRWSKAIELTNQSDHRLIDKYD